jgi:DNA-binding SARP family transcriptional activator
MFFPKLRKRARWVFAFIAVVFGLGFLVAGVGTGFGSGVGDYLSELLNRTPGAETGPSVESARKRVEENPSDPEALLAYSNALANDGNTREAITQLEAYLELRKDDPDALEQLATLYLTQATDAEERLQQAQRAAAYAYFGNDLFAGNQQLNQAFGSGGPISAYQQQAASSAYQRAALEMQVNYSKEAEAWKKLTELDENEPSFFLQLGRSSQSANNAKDAVAAFERYLELAPNDASADQVREIVKQLKQQLKANPALGGGTGE